MADGPSPIKDSKDGVTLALKVTPKASSNAVAGLEKTSDGGVVLKVRVTAPPEDGKANAAVAKLLAKTWKIPKSAIAIVSGTTSRHKLLNVTCDDAARKRIADWLKK